MSFVGFVSFLLIGALAGWLSGVIVKGRGFGALGNILVGVLGAFLGGFVLGILGIHASGLLGQLIFATLGALLLVWLLRFIKR
jgi:uncharacterized membrane protein YeaQ/YmgE (transglycosylase-associated protein family)